MSKRIITLGTWGGNPIEWIVLKEESFGTLVISKWEIGRLYFDDNNNNNWGSSSLRKYLKNDFFKTAFTEEEKKKILNVSLDDVKCKDDVFILTRDEICQLLSDDEYENRRYRSCDYCVWTRTKAGSTVHHGYATKGCWCSYSPSYNRRGIRPAMYIKE